MNVLWKFMHLNACKQKPFTDHYMCFLQRIFLAAFCQHNPAQIRYYIVSMCMRPYLVLFQLNKIMQIETLNYLNRILYCSKVTMLITAPLDSSHLNVSLYCNTQFTLQYLSLIFRAQSGLLLQIFLRCYNLHKTPFLFSIIIFYIVIISTQFKLYLIIGLK